MKHLQHTSKISETLEIYVCNIYFQHNIYFQRNIFLLLGNGGSLAHGVHRCRARRWRGPHCSGGEGCGPVPWRRVRRVRTLEKDMVGGKRGEEGGRRAAMLWLRGDAGRGSGAAMEREA
jgi:hypothetical protein